MPLNIQSIVGRMVYHAEDGPAAFASAAPGLPSAGLARIARIAGGADTPGRVGANRRSSSRWRSPGMFEGSKTRCEATLITSAELSLQRMCGAAEKGSSGDGVDERTDSVSNGLPRLSNRL
ncbi:hypothetical protein HJFPF1_01158 [Paramyrothecium foliicola]|nr:hypothetical protein HJFPF1_01158 [Paramyrothecium foliicola]